MTDHDLAIAHKPGVWYLACAPCLAAYEVAVATGMVQDYRAPGTDEEPLFIATNAPDRSWSGYALLACVVIGALVILLAGVRR